MSLTKVKLLTILLTFIAIPSIFAQSTSTQGKEFWVSFMYNGYTDVNGGGLRALQVTISAKRNCSGTISNPNTGWSQEFNVEANSIRNIEVPRAQCYHERNNDETISNFGLKIVASDTISAYCANIANNSFDASFILPTVSLGEDYIIQCGPQSSMNFDEQVKKESQTSAFLIIATEDNTIIDITPSEQTLFGHPANQQFTVTLNAGQTYQVRSNNTSTNNRDLSGTRITARDCKKIAVFNGNTLTHLPVETSLTTGFDHIFEQAMPLRSWGKKFIPTQSLTRYRDIVKVISSANNNVVKKNGVEIATLGIGDTCCFFIYQDNPSCFIETSQPSAVYLYNTSAYDTRANGDPSMVWIAPVEQRIDEVTFATFNHNQASINFHYVNIIVKTEDTQNVFLDGTPISPFEFRLVNGNNEYSYFRKQISHGSHHIKCANGFNAHVYGFGDAKGYAYLVGSNAIDLSTNLIINNLEVDANDIYPYCIEEPVNFTAEVNYQDYDLLWDFGDGQTSTQNPATHTYHSKQVFPAMLIVNTDESGCIASASDTTFFYVDVTQQYVDEYDTICSGEYYTGHGFNNIPILNDTILYRLQANGTNPVCQDSLRLHIHANESYHISIHDSRCWNGQPDWYHNHGFHFEYDHPDTYAHTLQLSSIHGCDSIVTLTLDVADQIEWEFSDHSCNGQYIWNGQSYNESGDYIQQFTSPQGCDSIVTLHLAIGQSQTYPIDTIVCDHFEWEGQIYDTSGYYSKTFTSALGCDSIVELNLTVNPIYNDTLHLIGGCDSFTWNNITFTENGYFTDSLMLPNGCDSIITYHISEMEYTPNPDSIQPKTWNTPSPHWVIPATEFQINTYHYKVEEANPNCHWTNVEWVCKGAPNWIVKKEDEDNQHPEKSSYVALTVLDRVEDTAYLTAYITNRCSMDSISYFLVCSFYGAEEQYVSPIEFNVAPNPNKGKMTLSFENFSGNINVKVYDMSGNLIDNIQTYGNYTTSTPFNNTLTYDMKRCTPGIYFFVANGKEGTIAKKVVIAK